jgi:hypothetical protein
MLKNGTMAFVAATLLTAAPLPALAATVYVANNGLDGPSCGAKGSPCRSITQGVAQAVDGDRVTVGPGLYGDIDGDGLLSSAGEEPGTPCNLQTCMIFVDKTVEVISEAGAYSTLIRPPSGMFDNIVGFTPPGAGVFGGKGRGFTIDASGGSRGILASGTGIVVAGNVVMASGDMGILFGGAGLTLKGNRVLCTSSAPTYGIFGFGTPASTLTDNAVLGCYLGIATFGDIAVSGSAVIGNVIGVVLDGASTATGVLAAGNLGAGIYVDNSSTSTSISSSSVIGNGETAGNCGIEASNTAASVTNIWYGASAGPGADPADELCNAGMVVSPTFSTKPIKVKLKPTR